jgi:hypothetical protein
MAMEKAGNAGSMYQESFVCAKVNTKSTTIIHTRINASAFKRLTKTLNAQSPAAKGRRIAQSLSLLAK